MPQRGWDRDDDDYYRDDYRSGKPYKKRRKSFLEELFD
jgi:Zn-finger nucleic acid-binding protein